MGHRLSRITTRTGDDGTTGLADGRRVRKESALVRVMGDVDELNCQLGVLRAELAALAKEGHEWVAPLDDALLTVQHDLFDLGGELAIGDAAVTSEAQVLWLEGQAATLNEALPPLKEFVLPAGSRAVAACHVARAVARRVERGGHELAVPGDLSALSQVYLNRLSDFLFVLARTVARRSGAGEVGWDRSRLRAGPTST